MGFVSLYVWSLTLSTRVYLYVWSLTLSTRVYDHTNCRGRLLNIIIVACGYRHTFRRESKTGEKVSNSSRRDRNAAHAPSSPTMAGRGKEESTLVYIRTYVCTYVRTYVPFFLVLAIYFLRPYRELSPSYYGGP